jgi:repressor LexA
MATKSLSPKQERIINFVTAFLHDKGYPPTIRDIAAGCGISSTSVVAYNLDKLEQAGYIRRHSDISRGIEFLTPRQKGRKLVYIPIVGVIAAGEPIPGPDTGTVVHNEGLEVSKELIRGKQDIYALRVKGNSMLDALIGDGDIVLMDYGNSAFADPNRIRLEPANSQMKPIYTAPDNVEIQGKVVAVIRRIS